MTTIKLRRGTGDRWKQVNPVLAQGEPGYDLDSTTLKIGDGKSHWGDLPGLTGAALTSKFVRSDAAQTWTASQQQQALDNIGSGRIWTPRQFGTTGSADDTGTFQKAVQSLHDDGGGTLWLDEPAYAVGGLLMMSNVVLRSLSQLSSLYPPVGFHDAWIIDTPPKPAKQRNIGIRDLVINGGVAGASSPNTGGILFRNTIACQVSNVSISQTSLGCFKQLAGQATQLTGCGFQNHYGYRTLTADEGTVWLLGTDHIVLGCECNAGGTRAGTADGFDEVQYPNDLFRCGILLAGGTSWVYGSNGEYADVGIKVTGAANRLIGARGDVNAGPGIVVEGVNNSLTNTMVLANSLGADGTYSHIQLGAGAYGTVLDGVTETLNFVDSFQVKFVIDDQVDIVNTPSYSDLLPHIRDVVHQQQYKYRKVNQRYVSRALQPSSAGKPAARPPSRYCSGATFYDVKSNELTISDGSFWRDASGAIVGNVIPPDRALLSDPAGLGWTAANSGYGTKGVAGVNGWQNFRTARALEITADGTASSCAAQTATAIANISRGGDLLNANNYTLTAYHLGETRTATLSFAVVWLDKNNKKVGSTVTTDGDQQSAVGTAQRYTFSGLTPASGAVAANLTAVFTRNGMGNGEAYQVTKICLVLGDDPGDFVEP